MTGPSLQEVQRWMKSKMLPPERAGAAAVPIELNEQAGEPGEERLSVYSGGYLARMEEALQEAYPAVRHVLGARTFHRLAHDYAARHPSRDFNLSLAGRELSSFLGDYPLTQEFPFLPDLAQLEWKVVEAFNVFDRPPVDLARLSGVPPEEWEKLRLAFQPSVSRIASAWPILDIWESRNRPIKEVRIDLVNRPQQTLIYRQNMQVRCELLDEPQDRLLSALLAGASLGAACESLASSGNSELPLSEWFSRWGSLGLIAAIQ